MHKRFKIPYDRVAVIPHGVSPVFRPLDEDKKDEIRKALNLPEKFIFSVGSTEPRKNLMILIKGLKQLKYEQSVPHKLVVAVSNKIPRRSRLHQTIQSLGIADDVQFVQVDSQESMCHYYNTAEIFVFPSRSEGFGFPVLEAMACGVPVLCSNIPPLTEITGDVSVRFEFDDYVTLGKKLYNLIIDEDERRELSRQGLERAKRFNWTKAAEQYLQIYTSVAS
jgi:glycosyltransferase involved in cell wall biosynthesis